MCCKSSSLPPPARRSTGTISYSERFGYRYILRPAAWRAKRSRNDKVSARYFIRQQTHAHRVIVRSVVFEDDAVILGQQIARRRGSVGLEQGGQRVVSNGTLRDHAKLTPFADRLPLAVPHVDARAHGRDHLGGNPRAVDIVRGIGPHAPRL